METGKPKKLKVDQQVDRMVDDGLGAGRIIEENDQHKIEASQELSKITKEKQKKEN